MYVQIIENVHIWTSILHFHEKRGIGIREGGKNIEKCVYPNIGGYRVQL